MSDASQHSPKDAPDIPDLQTSLPAEANRPPATGIEIDPRSKPSTEVTEGEKTATENQKETLTAVKKGERIALIIAGIVALATIGQLLTSCMNNASTSTQTDKLIQAAQMSAHSSDHNAAAAQSFAHSAEHINEGIEAAVEKLEKQASALEKARIASEKDSKQSLDAAIDSLHKSQRPWVNADGFEIKKMALSPTERFNIYGVLTMRNTGASIANEGWAMVTVVPNQTAVLVREWDSACKILDRQRGASQLSAAKGYGDTWPIGFVLAPGQETHSIGFSMGAI